MYARVVNVQLKQGMLDEAKRIINESVVPVLKDTEGIHKPVSPNTARYEQGHFDKPVGDRSRPHGFRNESSVPGSAGQAGSRSRCTAYRGGLRSQRSSVRL